MRMAKFLVLISIYHLTAVGQPFDPKRAANKDAWRHFLTASPQWRYSLWTSLEARTSQKQWEQWHWSWRIGWVKACGLDSWDFCRFVFRAGLDDKALVVRTAAVRVLARRYSGTADTALVALLGERFRLEAKTSYADTIRRDILYALLQVGGAKALELGGQLANMHPKSSSYWQKLLCSQIDMC